MQDIWMFVVALAAVYLVPGPDMLVILQTSGTQGKRAAFAAAAGLGLARAAHVTLAALGLATLLRTAPWAFEVVRMVGVAYLIWLGIKLARAKSLMVDMKNGAPEAVKAYRAAAWRGLLTNITNPKALLFCSVLLPQFVHVGGTDTGLQFLWLGFIVVIVGLLFDTMYVFTGLALGHWVNRNPLVQAIQRWVFASLLIAFGIKLAISGRPE